MFLVVQYFVSIDFFADFHFDIYKSIFTKYTIRVFADDVMTGFVPDQIVIVRRGGQGGQGRGGARSQKTPREGRRGEERERGGRGGGQDKGRERRYEWSESWEGRKRSGVNGELS